MTEVGASAKNPCQSGEEEIDNPPLTDNLKMHAQLQPITRKFHRSPLAAPA